MPYIVQAEESEDHSAVSKTHEDRKEALVTAVKWGSEGRKVQIIGNGRVLLRDGIGPLDHQRRAAIGHRRSDLFARQILQLSCPGQRDIEPQCAVAC
jgi:hypothetical protein